MNINGVALENGETGSGGPWRRRAMTAAAPSEKMNGCAIVDHRYQRRRRPMGVTASRSGGGVMDVVAAA